ncbi:MAG: hypothetical protein K9W44_10725 [Candidatus Lokiarchaeota archaeon]|nr:hypothetical protein [Candidatus Harpocratesius repetitus]
MGNLTQIANNTVLGIISYDPLRNEEPVYLNQINLKYLGEIAVDVEVYKSSYPLFVPDPEISHHTKTCSLILLLIQMYRVMNS